MRMSGISGNGAGGLVSLRGSTMQVALSVYSHKSLLVLIWCLLFYVLATSKGISGEVPTCDSVHSLWLYSAASLEHQVTSTMTCYPTQPHYPDTEPTSPCPILIMLNARPRKWQVSILKSFIWLGQVSDPRDLDSNARSTDSPHLPKRELGALLIQPPWLVNMTLDAARM